jgi:hypothetical protein
MAHGAIELSDKDWQKWKHSRFDGSELKRLMGSAFPAHVEQDITKILQYVEMVADDVVEIRVFC